MSRIDYLSISCGHCGAVKGEGCKSRTGRDRGPHAARTKPLRDAWRSGVRAGQDDLLRSPQWYERERKRWLNRQGAGR